MARRVFFSFHYERDVQRASVVRNSWITKGEDAGFIDSASWEAVKRQGDEAIKRWVERQLDGTSVTVVLIGAETASRSWVQYEIRRSYARRNGLLGIHLHNIKDFVGKKDYAGNNTFGEIAKRSSGNSVYFFQIAETYDWVNDNGYANLGRWVEDAARKAGR